jgi:hypothetical protein
MTPSSPWLLIKVVFLSSRNADCTLDFSDPNDFAVEHFSDDADVNNLSVVVKSLSCQAIPGLVNGLFPQ